jgi:hypothetical protein
MTRLLDQHPTVGADMPTKNVGTKQTDGPFLSLQLQINAKRVAQDREVFGPGAHLGRTYHPSSTVRFAK